MNINFFLLIVLSSLSIFSQKKVIDSLSQKPIAFAEIYSETGKILGSTDYNGEMSENLIKKINALKFNRLLFNSVNYQTKSITFQEFSNLNKVLLIPFQMDKINKLEEVVVNSRKSHKYTKLTAYFRSIQFNDNQPQYFMDGIVEYYIDNKNNKTKYLILKNRSLKDNSIKQVDDKGVIRMRFNTTGLPYLGDFIDFKKLKNEYTINGSNDNLSIIKENVEIGRIKTENDKTQLDLEIYSEKKPKIMNLFGVESILKNYTINAQYDKNTFSNILKNLTYYKEYREYNIKMKKEKDYTSINCINEIYVIKRELTDDVSKSLSNLFYTFINESSYNDNFWINLGIDTIKPMPKSVELFIEKNLSKL